jgi:DNA modification methylase
MSGVTWQIREGDCRDVLRTLPERSAQTVCTSPPYFGLRNYGHGGQIGLEATPDEFVAALVAVFREVRRVLRDDGTVWLNLGDSYAASSGVQTSHPQQSRNGRGVCGPRDLHPSASRANVAGVFRDFGGAKPKDLLGIPWMVAFALRADGWYLRSDIIWHKPNPMPESVTDRPTRAHEYLFLLSKRPRYFYDADAIRESSEHTYSVGHVTEDSYSTGSGRNDGNPHRAGIGFGIGEAGRNKRSVWTVATQPYPGAHFATFPPKLIEPCILAGAPERACGECGAPWQRIVDVRANGPGKECPKDRESWEARLNAGSISTSRLHGAYYDVQRATVGFEPSCDHDAPPTPGVVLDPFSGAGTTGLVALRHNRSYIGCELSPEYAELSRQRIIDDAPLLNAHAEAVR